MSLLRDLARIAGATLAAMAEYALGTEVPVTYQPEGLRGLPTFSEAQARSLGCPDGARPFTVPAGVTPLR